jgi:gluconokinase
MVIVLMGVSGCGKTTVGRLLAQELDCVFCEGDEYHPATNVQKMSQGTPLSEDDRLPWLGTLATMIDGWIGQNQNAVLACSALTRKSRKLLGTDSHQVRLVHLSGTFELVHERLERRRGHYFAPSLLQSQFDTLEEPTDALTVDVSRPPSAIVAKIRSKLVV